MTYLDPKFNDLRVLQSRPGPTDDDIEFANDMSYFRNLLQALVAQAAIYGGRVSEFPIGMSDQLDAAISELKSVRYV
jgi:hypothetical protein